MVNWEVVVKKLDGTQATTQLNETQIREVISSGGQVFIRWYTITATLNGVPVQVSTMFNIQGIRELERQGLTVTKGPPIDDRIIIPNQFFGPQVVPTPTPTPTPEGPDPSPIIEEPTTQKPIEPTTQGPGTTEQISISPGVFQIINDRVAGEVLYIAATSFEGTQAKAFLQIKNASGTQLIVKENILSFIQDREERIFYNENAFGETSLTAELFVWSMDNAPLSGVKSFPVTKLEPIGQPPFIPPPRTPSPGVAGTPFGIAAIGLLGLGVLGALGVGKKK